MKLVFHPAVRVGAPAALLLVHLTASAQQIVLSSSNVIGGSAPYQSSSYTGGTFPATKIVDHQTGTITSDAHGDIWLGADGATTGYFVLDLGAAYTLSQIALYNTHNSIYNDRGTANFHLSASNSVSLVNANLGYNLSSPTTILSGTLSFSTGTPTAQNYTSANGLSTGTAYRYLSFTFDSIAGSGTPAGGGLNEIRISAIPEPATSAVIGGIAVAAFVARRRFRLATTRAKSRDSAVPSPPVRRV